MNTLEPRSSLRRIAGAAAATAAVAAAGIGLTAAPVHAAEFVANVTVGNGQISLVAADGQTDGVEVNYFFDFIEIRDMMNRINLSVLDNGPSCTQPYAHIVRCAPTGINLVHATLSDGDDSFINRTSLPSIVSGGDGNDKLTGGSNRDSFNGGQGVDTLHGGAGPDELEGGPGQDDVYGDDGDDRLTSLHNDDELFGGNGNDTLFSSIDVHGDAGDDTIIMNSNLGEYWGGEGGDTIDYSHWKSVSVTLDGNANDTGVALQAGDGQHNVHGDVDIVIGSPGNDRLIGNDSPNRLEGEAGNDQLFGKGGNDILNAGTGSSQTIDGGTGYDRCTGFNIVMQHGCD